MRGAVPRPRASPLFGSGHSTESIGERISSQPRPLTLLIACGVVLAVALLIVTGLVAGYLRQQTLESSEAGLLRVDAGSV